MTAPLRCSLLLLLLTVTLHAENARRFDLVVYGGTAGGVITAVTAAREGLNVALLEPTNHLGGMLTGGLSWTDYGKKEVIGGYSLEFFKRVGKKYGAEIEWHFEPRIAEEVFNEMLKEASVAVFLKHRLNEKGGVRKRGAELTAITMENGATFEGKVFVDSTYEGDLMAQSGVEWTYGREGTSQYNESLAGVREHTPKHQFTVRVSPYDTNKKLLPEIQGGRKGEPGEADKKVQAYNFRMILTDVKANQVPFPKPPNYSAARYELLARMLKAMDEEFAKHGRKWLLQDVIKPDRIRGGKFDVNNNGAFSTDYIGCSWRYPLAGYAERSKIRQAHRDYVAGFFYFLAHDPQVPKDLQVQAQELGLAEDEFRDNQHWPYQLYVRESRRMVGMYVVTQKDIQTELTKPDVIGMGSYNSDSHNVQRVPTQDGAVENEGDMQVPVTPYQIPYRIMLPKKAQATNLLVPVCFSASHVAYSTLRMEPQYMIIGQAAGVAAKMAIEKGTGVQDVDTVGLTIRLRAQRAVMEWTPDRSKVVAR